MFLLHPNTKTKQNKNTETLPKPKGQKGTFGGDAYVHYLDCGNGNKSVYICSNSNCTLIICNFLYTNYTSIQLEKQTNKQTNKTEKASICV